MANPYINIYKNNPTAGLTDGTLVSTDGEFTSPINFVLDATQNESKILKLAIRTEQGYVTTGEVTISDVNDTNDRLKLSWTENGTFADSISTTDEITAVNKIFYAKGSSVSSERPQTDNSASFQVSCVVASAV